MAAIWCVGEALIDLVADAPGPLRYARAFRPAPGGKERGVAVPEEMALVSFGEVDYHGQLIDPPLTVARQRPEVMGARDGELLLARLRGKARTTAERRYEVLPVELVVRESCGRRRPSVR